MSLNFRIKFSGTTKVTRHKKVCPHKNIIWINVRNESQFSYLIFRYNKRDKTQERTVLTQALTMQKPPMTASSPLPAPKPLLKSPPRVEPDQQHQFDLPPNTTGMAKVRGGPVKRQLFENILPKPSASGVVFVPAEVPFSTAPASSILCRFRA
jgi:hypothetical protein